MESITEFRIGALNANDSSYSLFECFHISFKKFMNYFNNYNKLGL